MTVHSAKGLEFSVVFLVGLEEGLLPHKLSLAEEAGIEEERRLCYVGMTRAKDLLVLTRARQRRSAGAESFDATRPSRFLREIPEQLLEPINAVALSTKPRMKWESAVNSVAGAERFLRQRGVASSDRQHSRPSGSRWKRGARVRHPAYGLGTILDCEGDGEDAKLTISFPGYGQKKFIEGKAPLEKA
jgi:DNA helicase-2/ATP-dependent DNA helicase PcrA